MKQTSRPTPPPIPDGLTPEERHAFLEHHGQAHNLEHKTAGAYAYGAAASSIANNLSPQAFDLLIKNVLEEAGSPSDPLEKMMIEQVVIAHHAIGRLHMQSAAADNVELAEVYSNAAVKLLGEFRRCVLALKKYREPSGPKNVMFVKQQNVAEEQQVAFVDGQPAAALSDNGDTTQRTKELDYASPTRSFPANKPKAINCREKKPAKARPTNGRGARATAASCVGEQALAEVNGATHG